MHAQFAHTPHESALDHARLGVRHFDAEFVRNVPRKTGKSLWRQMAQILIASESFALVHIPSSVGKVKNA
jgi:hypothetical protein